MPPSRASQENRILCSEWGAAAISSGPWVGRGALGGVSRRDSPQGGGLGRTRAPEPCAAMWLHPQGTAASTKNKLPSLITSMETVGAKALEDFADNIKVPFLCPRHPGRQAGLQAGPPATGLRNS